MSSDHIEVVPYSAEQAPAWEALVASATNGTLFHQRRFLAYHPPERFADASVMVRRGGSAVAVVPAAWIDDPELGRVWSSHPGASYGGPAFAPNVSGRTIVHTVEALLRHARSAGADLFQTRLPPHVFHRRPVEELEFALAFHGCSVWRSELSTCVDLDRMAPELMDSFRPACRRNLKKALRSGLVAGESDDFAQFWDVLADNLAREYGESPTHGYDEIMRLRQLAPDAVRLFVARDGDRIAAGTCVFVINDWSVHTFYMASRKDMQPSRPLNLALYAAMGWARDGGYRRFNFGVSTPQGRSVNWGLLRFKESFGGRGVVRNTYRKKLSP